MKELSDLPFTVQALALATERGHSAAQYAGIEPGSSTGKYTVGQVEAIDALVPAVEVAEAPPTAPLAEVVDASEPVPVGNWNGHPNYGCPYCSLTSLDPARVRDHVTRAHKALTGP